MEYSSEEEFIAELSTIWPDLPKMLAYPFNMPLHRVLRDLAVDAFVRDDIDIHCKTCRWLRDELTFVKENEHWSWL